MSRSSTPSGVNLAVLVGTLVQPPEERTMPSGATVASLEVRVAGPGATSETVPARWVAPPPAALRWSAGARIVVVGRVQRRFFRSGGATQSRTEVAVHAAAPARQRARVARLLAEAGATLAAGG